MGSYGSFHEILPYLRRVGVAKVCPQGAEAGHLVEQLTCEPIDPLDRGFGCVCPGERRFTRCVVTCLKSGHFMVAHEADASTAVTTGACTAGVHR
jgi:hypothetical protein